MKFLTDKNLSSAICDTIYNAEKYILILSPFIQLDEYFKDKVFKTHQGNTNLHIILAFGKNENQVSKSFKKQDIEYFKQFWYITIVYLKDLHGKYYGSESQGIITSMNLIDYSFKNNIEFGVLSEKKLVSKNTLFNETQEKCLQIIEDIGDVIFVNRPNYEKKLFFKKAIGFKNSYDGINDIISNPISRKRRKLSEFSQENYVNAALKDPREEREAVSKNDITPTSPPRVIKSQKIYDGYCIDCKDPIPLNIKRPFCKGCFSNWNREALEIQHHCISCGKDKPVCFNKPACYDCFKEVRKKLTYSN